jgi:hypothetical protein
VSSCCTQFAQAGFLPLPCCCFSAGRIRGTSAISTNFLNSAPEHSLWQSSVAFR